MQSLYIEEKLKNYTIFNNTIFNNSINNQHNIWKIINTIIYNKVENKKNNDIHLNINSVIETDSKKLLTNLIIIFCQSEMYYLIK